MELYLNLAMTVCALVGMFFGLEYLQPRKPLYASMIVLGVGCIALGRIYQCARLVTGLDIDGLFQLGIFGTVGAFSFFFSSNYGQIDSLVDDRSAAFLRYRLIAWAGPLVVAALYVLAIRGTTTPEKITYGCIAVSVAAASYFHIKHLLIPDVDYGIVRCLRQFNAVALVYGLLCMAEIIARGQQPNGSLLVGVQILQCITSIMIVPIMNKGVKMWTN